MKGVDLMITLTLLVLAILIGLIILLVCGWTVIIPLLDVLIAVLIIVGLVKLIRGKKK